MLTCCSNAFTFISCMANAGMAMISCELLAVPVVAGEEPALNTRLLTANSPRSRINWKAVSCSKTSACKLKLTLPSTKSASIKSFESDQSGVSATSFIAMSVVTFNGDNWNSPSMAMLPFSAVSKLNWYWLNANLPFDWSLSLLSLLGLAFLLPTLLELIKAWVSKSCKSTLSSG